MNKAVRRSTRTCDSGSPRIAAVLVVVALGFFLLAGAGFAQSNPFVTQPEQSVGKPNAYVAPDLTKQRTLYVVGYAHLDTQWRWEFPQVISEFLPKTMRLNFDLFEKYPHYIFNFSGANRYRLMKEYFPADYAKVKQYVAAGRWFPAGSSGEEGDVNSPSPESIIRQVLYGNEYFRPTLEWRAPNPCCPTASASPLCCRTFWRRASKVSRRRNSSGVVYPRGRPQLTGTDAGYRVYDGGSAPTKQIIHFTPVALAVMLWWP